MVQIPEISQFTSVAQSCRNPEGPDVTGALSGQALAGGAQTAQALLAGLKAFCNA